MYAYTGLVCVLLSWIGIAVILYRHRGSNLKTISKHAANSQHTALVFAVLLIGLGILFYAWCITWLRAQLAVSSWFLACMTLTLLCQIITGLARDVSGVEGKIHRTAAYSMAVMYAPTVLSMLASDLIHDPARIIMVLLLLYMITTFMLFVLVRRIRKYYLPFQSLYIVAFQLQFIVAAYL